MKHAVWLLWGLLLPTVAAGATALPVEASMVVTGTITVHSDGTVKGFSIHRRDAVPPGVVALVERTIKAWQFEPVLADGKAVTAEAGMAVRVVADKVDADHVAIKVSGANFGCDAYQTNELLPGACPPDTKIESMKRRPPRYPGEALKYGMGGTVYLVMEIGRDGRVTRAEAQQVNLSNQIQKPGHFRDVLARSARDAAMRWTYKVPTAGPGAGRDHWVVRVPVNYSVADTSQRIGDGDDYGRWHAYVPGPVQDIPWAHAGPSPLARGSADAIAGGGTFVPDARLVLKHPPGSGGEGS